MNELIKIKLFENNSYTIFIEEKQLLYIYITKKEKKPQKIYKKIFSLNDLKNLFLANDILENDYLKNLNNISEFTKLILIKENKDSIQFKEIKNNQLELTIKFLKPFSFSLKINFKEILEIYKTIKIEYYITEGPIHKRLNEKPYFTYLNDNENNYFTLEIIKSILKKDKINIDIIKQYRYYDINKKGLIKLSEFTYYPILASKLIFDFEISYKKDSFLIELKNLNIKLKDKIKKIKEKRNLLYINSKQNENYDFIYLYASPLIQGENAKIEPINYRLEIKKLINLFIKTKKGYNCLFECANENILKNSIKKKPKILHISSHGRFEESKKGKDSYYYLILENDGISKEIGQIKLEKILNQLKNQLRYIDLVFVSTCYSETLGKLFFEKGVKNVVYIHGKTKIMDLAALKFSEYFYEELLKGNNIKDSFYKAQQKLISNRKIIIKCGNEYEKKFDQELPQNESSKFILISSNGGECSPLSIKNKGQFLRNENFFYDFDDKKYNSIIGRTKELKEIYDIINDYNKNSPYIIIIYGEREIGKKNFAEYACVYLLERRIIKNFYFIEIKTKNEFSKKKEKILNYDKNNKIVIIIKICYELDEKNSIELLNYILDILDEKYKINNNIYFIVLLSTQNDKIREIKKCKIIKLKELDRDSSYDLLKNICESLDLNQNFQKLKIEHIHDLLKIVKYKHKFINYLAELILEKPDYEIIKERLKNKFYKDARQRNQFEELMENKISKLFLLLTYLPLGLPISIIRIIYPYLYTNLYYYENDLLFINPEDQWYHINYFFKKDILKYFNDKIEIKKECISNSLKEYARLLFFYIEKNKKDICFPDGNIHYIFNSYNGEDIWKTFDDSLYEYCFLYEIDKEQYFNIIKNDFIINNHKDNIIYLIENNLEFIKNLLKNNDIIIKEYLEQILLMLPSIYFLDKNCKKIIDKCKYLSEQLGLENNKKRLLIFLYSIQNNPIINQEEIIFDKEEYKYYGKAEYFFINGLKNKDKKSFYDSKENYEKINTSDNIKKKIGYSEYEIAALFFNEKKYKEAESLLIEAKNKFEEIKDNFLIDRCNIDLVRLKQRNKKNYEECDKILCKLLNSKNSFLQKEAYELKKKLNDNLGPDIVILNSNPLSNGINVLDSGIFAYLNNQYYMLQKIQEKIKLDIKIKSILLNKKNLEEALNKDGKILIIQSDDFSKEGEIILESEIGQSQPFSINELKLLLLQKQKIDYKVIILCFINSSKIIDLFKDKVPYLITFDEINFFNLDYETLLEYNKLSINFLIDFIQKTANNNYNIKEGFEDSKENFIKSLNKLDKYPNIKANNYITLTQQFDNGKRVINIDYEKNFFRNTKKGKIVLVEPLPDLPFKNLRNKDYAYEIFNLIKLIISNNYNLFNIHLNNDKRVEMPNNYKVNKKTIIGIEIMRFLYRHQIFTKLYYVLNPKKFGINLKEISENKIFGNLKNDKEMRFFNYSSPAFILINNFERIKCFKYMDSTFELLDNIQYLVFSKNEIVANIEKYKNYNESDKKYKKKIIVRDSIYKIICKSLISDNSNEKKFRNKKNKIQIFENFNSIFSNSFDSQKTWSSDEKSNDDL